MRNVALLALLAAPCLSLAAKVTFEPLPQTGQARVTITIDAPSTTFRMPAWAPGDYEIFDYGRNIDAVEFRRGERTVSAVQGRDPNAWTVEGGADAVTYLVNPSRANFTVNLRVTPSETFVSGPAVFGWFEGHADETQELRVVPVPANATLISTLEGSGLVRTAPNYDELIDAPFVLGNAMRSKEFEVRGKPHRIVAFGYSEGADLDGFAKLGAAAAEQAYRLFGELPYPRYYFFFDIGGSGGGLEHSNSTRIGLRGRSSPAAATGILFHEYFHAFNVKRIRSKPLGPFDYTKPAVTGALWWLEGVTDYYADLFEARAGLITRGQLLQSLSFQVAGFERDPNRLRVSADESSRRVWEVRGSNGYGFSYYAKGKVVGLALDLAIRGASQGERSLDDVMRALYAECKDGKPGFAEGRIRELAVQFGGAAMGPLYDRLVLKPGPLPLDEIAPTAGMAWTNGRLVDDGAADPERRKIGAAWPGRASASLAGR